MELSVWIKPLLGAAAIGTALAGGAGPLVSDPNVSHSNGAVRPAQARTQAIQVIAETVVAGERYAVGGTITSTPRPDHTRQPLIRHSVPGNIRFTLNGEIEADGGLPAGQGDNVMIAGIRHGMEGNIYSASFLQRKVDQILDRVPVSVEVAQTVVEDELRRQSTLAGLMAAANQALARVDSSVAAGFSARRSSFVGRGSDDGTTMRLTVAPRASLSLNQRDLSIMGSYQLAYGQEFGQRRNVFQSHAAQMRLNRQVFTRSSVSLGASYSYANDEPDLTNPGPAVQRQQSSLNVGFDRGGSADRLKFGFDLGWSKNSFSGYLNSFGGQSQSLTAQVGYRFRPRLVFDLNANFSASSYGDSELDALSERYQVGMDYILNPRLHVNFDFGVASKQLDVNGRSSTGLAWSGSMSWRPRRSTSVSFSTSRSFVETYQFSGEDVGDSLIQSQSFTASWKQSWSSRMSTIVGVRSVSTPSGSYRDFLGNSISFGMSYEISEAMKFGLQGAFEEVRLDDASGSGASVQVNLSLDL